jgi:hypothetical protein
LQTDEAELGYLEEGQKTPCLIKITRVGSQRLVPLDDLSVCCGVVVQGKGLVGEVLAERSTTIELVLEPKTELRRKVFMLDDPLGSIAQHLNLSDQALS